MTFQYYLEQIEKRNVIQLLKEYILVLPIDEIGDSDNYNDIIIKILNEAIDRDYDIEIKTINIADNKIKIRFLTDKTIPKFNTQFVLDIIEVIDKYEFKGMMNGLVIGGPILLLYGALVNDKKKFFTSDNFPDNEKSEYKSG